MFEQTPFCPDSMTIGADNFTLRDLREQRRRSRDVEKTRHFYALLRDVIEVHRLGRKCLSAIRTRPTLELKDDRPVTINPRPSPLSHEPTVPLPVLLLRVPLPQADLAHSLQYDCNRVLSAFR